VECAIGNGLAGKKESKRCRSSDGRTCRIHVHSRRIRLADPDGISVKAVIDGLCHVGLLEDDNAKIITEVSQSQEKSKVNETIIDIIWD
jgi:hypothetical protein